MGRPTCASGSATRISAVLSLERAFALFTHSGEPPGGATHTKPRGQRIGPHCLACGHFRVFTRAKGEGRRPGQRPHQALRESEGVLRGTAPRAVEGGSEAAQVLV